jgi:homoserine dehydrogenase
MNTVTKAQGLQALALIGHGTVGKALYQQLNKLPGYVIAGVAVKHPEKHSASIPPELLHRNAMDLINDERVTVVLEAIDDEAASLEYAKRALELGKTYITASKKMVANHMETLHLCENQFGAKLLYDAAVCGAIPVLRTLHSHLKAEPIHAVRGILNGTCNYILSRMWNEEIGFEEALEAAQSLGFAESDPSSDVDGHDTYYKALLIARTMHSGTPPLSRVQFEGIRQVSSADVSAAKKHGQKIKLVANIQQSPDKFTIDIRPTNVEAGDALYHVDGALNAVSLEGLHMGTLTLQGLGAGGHPTASAMVGDLMNTPQQALLTLRKVRAQLGV